MDNTEMLIKMIEQNREHNADRFDRLDGHLEKYNDLLQEHIAGVKTNTARLDVEIQSRKEKNTSHEGRIFKVEENRKKLEDKVEDISRRAITPKRILKWSIGISTICGAIYSVYRVINLK